MLITLKTIRDLIPESNFHKQNGSLSKSLFGIATMDDVKILASHINALNRQSKKIAFALKSVHEK